MAEPAQTVEQRLAQRIKDQLPALLDDADLQELVKRTVHTVFFAPRKAPKPHYSYNEPPDLPPLLCELTKELLASQVTAAIDRWLEANKALVAEQMARAFAAGIGGCVLESLSQRFDHELCEMQRALREKGLYK